MCDKTAAHNRSSSKSFNDFKNICIAHGFTQRGKAFFRIVGDGVLQVLKFSYEFRPPHHEISVGLFSMYGELDEQWFSAGGCIPRYSVINLTDNIGAVLGEAVDSNGFHVPYQKRKISIEDHIAILAKEGIPKLNQISTQTRLAEAICALDIARGNKIIWNDGIKYAPFLCAGDYEKAANVITAILAQHNNALISYQQTLTESEYQKRYTEIQEMNVHYLEKLRIAEEADEQAAIAYAGRNFSNNLKFARFIRPYL